MKKICFALILTTLFVVLLPVIATSHPGRTDANGGHWNRKTGIYHFHTGEYAGKGSSGSTSKATNPPVSTVKPQPAPTHTPFPDATPSPVPTITPAPKPTLRTRTHEPFLTYRNTISTKTYVQTPDFPKPNYIIVVILFALVLCLFLVMVFKKTIIKFCRYFFSEYYSIIIVICFIAVYCLPYIVLKLFKDIPGLYVFLVVFSPLILLIAWAILSCIKDFVLKHINRFKGSVHMRFLKLTGVTILAMLLHVLCIVVSRYVLCFVVYVPIMGKLFIAISNFLGYKGDYELFVLFVSMVLAVTVTTTLILKMFRNLGKRALKNTGIFIAVLFAFVLIFDIIAAQGVGKIITTIIVALPPLAYFHYAKESI